MKKTIKYHQIQHARKRSKTKKSNLNDYDIIIKYCTYSIICTSSAHHLHIIIYLNLVFIIDKFEYNHNILILILWLLKVAIW